MIGSEIATYIAASSTAFTAGTDLFVNSIPESAAPTATGIYETGGTAPSHVLNSTRPTFERPGFQVLCRSTSYLTARTNAENVYLLLDNTVNSTDLGPFYLTIAAQQSPFSLGPDENDYQRIVCNYLVRKEFP